VVPEVAGSSPVYHPSPPPQLLFLGIASVFSDSVQQPSLRLAQLWELISGNMRLLLLHIRLLISLFELVL
jgi:hypothetical protein